MSAWRWYVPAGLCVAVVAMTSLLQAEETAQEAIEQLKSKAKSVESGSADLKITTTMMGQQVAMDGKLLFESPDKIHMDIDMSMGSMKMEQVTVSNGNTVWTYQPMMKMVSKIDLEKVAAATGIKRAGQQNSGEIAKPFAGLEPDSIKLVGSREIDGAKADLFEGKPQMANMPNMPFKFAKVEILVGAEDGLLHQMTMLDQDGKPVMSETYSNIKTNVQIPAGTFEFTPPQGVQVMDMTEGTTAMIKAMQEEKK